MDFFKKVFRKVGGIFWSVFLFVRNHFFFRQLGRFKKEEKEEITFKGLTKNNKKDFFLLYKELNNGSEIRGFRRLLINLFSEKCILAAYYGRELIGFDYFYFNQKDFQDSTIHEGFVGVKKSYRKKGIANNFRSISTKHFASYHLGVSTRISTNNIPSINSAFKNGFKIKETYIEDNGEERNYLVFQRGVKPNGTRSYAKDF